MSDKKEISKGEAIAHILSHGSFFWGLPTLYICTFFLFGFSHVRLSAGETFLRVLGCLSIFLWGCYHLCAIRSLCYFKFSLSTNRSLVLENIWRATHKNWFDTFIYIQLDKTDASLLANNLMLALLAGPYIIKIVGLVVITSLSLHFYLHGVPTYGIESYVGVLSGSVALIYATPVFVAFKNSIFSA